MTPLELKTLDDLIEVYETEITAIEGMAVMSPLEIGRQKTTQLLQDGRGLFIYTSTLICPYCEQDNGNDDVSHDDSGYGFRECCECEKRFKYFPCIDVTFSSYQLPCMEGVVEHNWILLGFCGFLLERHRCSYCGSEEMRDIGRIEENP